MQWEAGISLLMIEPGTVTSAMEFEGMLSVEKLLEANGQCIVVYQVKFIMQLASLSHFQQHRLYLTTICLYHSV